MDDHLGLVLIEAAADKVGVCYRSFDQCQAVVRSEVVAPGRFEVVDHDHAVTSCEQSVCQVGAQEAGSTGDQNLH